MGSVHTYEGNLPPRPQPLPRTLAAAEAAAEAEAATEAEAEAATEAASSVPAPSAKPAPVALPPPLAKKRCASGGVDTSGGFKRRVVVPRPRPTPSAAPESPGDGGKFNFSSFDIF